MNPESIGGHLVAVVCYHSSCHSRCIFTSHVACCISLAQSFPIFELQENPFDPRGCMWSVRKLPPRLTKNFRLSQFNRACVRRAMRTLSSGATTDICCSAHWKAPNDRQGTDAARATPSRSPRDLVYRSCWEYTTVRWRSNTSE